MDYNFSEIEKNWQAYWQENQTFAAVEKSDKPKYYVLDMFPYPSGAGLHVGHPLGYIASDIYSRYKRHLGFNVLHPMGYDSFGLPAEQYAIQTGQHPKITTKENIATYRRQLDQIGFSFDWAREVRTSNPEYYKWTQWIFIQLFNSWYNKATDRAEDLKTLVSHFETKGTAELNAHHNSELTFTADEWKSKPEKEQQAILMDYRLTFLADSFVNWCPALGTVLANDEIKDGVSERGGHPVERKKMQQWSMRITAYAQRLLDGLDKIDWSDAIKEIQRNWIGKSKGASIRFDVSNTAHQLEVFTTRPDTIFGVSFMVIAPEHELVAELTSNDQKEEIEVYVKYAASRSERERMTEVKKVGGAFTGSYATHPFTGKQIPIWIGDFFSCTLNRFNFYIWIKWIVFYPIF
ncbi:MAG: class I tRNA ligase family protein, partial [Flavobacteriales bacterium]|nr:class I tRNA ligase family protein [Flavobacteriales bacterium]